MSSDNLTKAATVLERNGLHRGAFYDREQHVSTGTPVEECRVCLLGALNVAVGRGPAYMIDSDDPALVAVAAQISDYVRTDDDLTEAIADWSDRLAADGAAVVRVLLAAAAAESEAGR